MAREGVNPGTLIQKVSSCDDTASYMHLLAW